MPIIGVEMRVPALLIACGVTNVACKGADSPHKNNVAEVVTGSDRKMAGSGAESPGSSDVESSSTSTTTCDEEATKPERLGDEGTIQGQFPDFPRLYATGDFRMGYCTTEATMTEEGRLVEIRIVRPKDLDFRVKEELLHTLESWRFKPATLCGKPVAVPFTVGFGHCAVQHGASVGKPG